MSLFAQYPQELEDMERQVRRSAAACGINPDDQAALETCLHDHAAKGARATLRAMLILRMKVQADMMSAGLSLTPKKPVL